MIAITTNNSIKVNPRRDRTGRDIVDLVRIRKGEPADYRHAGRQKRPDETRSPANRLPERLRRSVPTTGMIHRASIGFDEASLSVTALVTMNRTPASRAISTVILDQLPRSTGNPRPSNSRHAENDFYISASFLHNPVPLSTKFSAFFRDDGNSGIRVCGVTQL
jgi:hypothetical protein